MSTPNYPLALALAAAGWSNHETARRLNACASHAGYRGIAVDHTRVGRWIRRGERPRPPIPALLAELLSEHLGQLHTPEELRLTQNRPLRINLEHTEHRSLATAAAAANLRPEEFVRALIRAAVQRPGIEQPDG
ncbi:hypothetical protein [Streptomyces poonensis]|uniref:Uncharacterized protein n=1 Tax=Streptomyces poonensis TaxID=68255 RepID=A0A918PGA0_9ACTN|nr:hypothetical protein [Streptomyces poonensis]GGZ05761.1 hypothetical protein GCM10010365_26270 [Streptomyces poonensis]GLJ92591.1 hypothetical protein GCM10017589_52010 [Streptomyces poonensis]